MPNGLVYFATDQGLCSYMSDVTATNEEMTKDNVYAYPNPVNQIIQAVLILQD